QLAVSWIPWSLCLVFLCLFIRMRQPRSTLFPYTPLFRSNEIARLCDVAGGDVEHVRIAVGSDERIGMQFLYPGLGFGGSCFPKEDRKSTRLNSSHVKISYAVFCLKKKRHIDVPCTETALT